LAITREKESQTQKFFSDKNTSEKQIQTLESVNKESTDKNSQTTNTIITEAKSISREVQTNTPTIKDESSQTDNMNMNKISQNQSTQITTYDDLPSLKDRDKNTQPELSKENNCFKKTNIYSPNEETDFDINLVMVQVLIMIQYNTHPTEK